MFVPLFKGILESCFLDLLYIKSPLVVPSQIFLLVAKSNKSVLRLLDIEELKFPVDINKNIVDKLLKHSDKTGISEAALVNMYS